MGFESVNEIDKFSFDDCVVKKFEVQEGQLYLELEALIVKAGNSQNTNYTESYAGPTTVRLKEGKILSGIQKQRLLCCSRIHRHMESTAHIRHR